MRPKALDFATGELTRYSASSSGTTKAIGLRRSVSRRPTGVASLTAATIDAASCCLPTLKNSITLRSHPERPLRMERCKHQQNLHGGRLGMRLERGGMVQACRPRSRVACMPLTVIGSHLGTKWRCRASTLGVRGSTARARVAIGSPSPGCSGSGNTESESAAAVHQVDGTMQRAHERREGEPAGRRATGSGHQTRRAAGDDNAWEWERAGRTRRL